jgi:hypothetical protein
MIPPDYMCGRCGAEGVKLWRGYNESHVELRCGDCAASEQKREVDLSEGDQIGWSVPAVPDLRGSWWGYTSVPAEGCAWWKALPLRHTGEWKVRGGRMVWMSYSAATREMVDNHAKMERVDFHREGGAVALVFMADGFNGEAARRIR